MDLSFQWKRLTVAAHYVVQHISQSYLDEANLFLPVPQQTLCDVGVLIYPLIEKLSVALTFRNIANLRVESVEAPSFTGMTKIPRALADYGGFPLPGFSFHVALVWRS